MSTLFENAMNVEKNLNDISIKEYALFLEDLLISEMYNQDYDDNYCIDESFENIDITYLFFNLKKDLREKAKITRKHLKQKEFKEAKDNVDKMIASIKKTEADIRKIDAGHLSNIITGYFGAVIVATINANFGLLMYIDNLVQGTQNEPSPILGGLRSVESLVDIVTNTLPKGASQILLRHPFTLAKSLVDLWRNIKTFIDEARNNQNANLEFMNLYRNRIIRFLNEYVKALQNTKKFIDKLENQEKEK